MSAAVSRLRVTACALLVLLVSLVASAGPGSSRARASGAPDGRPYRLLVSSVAGPRPLLVALHGFRLDPAWMQQHTGLDGAVAQGFDVAYLAGVHQSWDAGSCCGVAATDHVDDLDYVKAVITAVEATHPIDPTRVYAVGFSNGGMLAWRLACAHIVDAAVDVAGSLVAACPAPVTVLDIHGRHDRTVPYQGGYSGFTRTYFPDQPDLRLPYGSHVSRVLWDGGHEWPSWATGRLLAWLRRLPDPTRIGPRTT